MGDSSRNLEFSKFIRRNFPLKRFPSVCCVADGKMELSLKLAQHGYRVVCVEPKPRKTAKFGAGKFRSKLSVKSCYFNENSLVDESLIVGMHPDGATIEIVLAANRNKIPFAVVPCCIVGKFSKSVQDSRSWVKLIQSLSKKPTLTTALKISGKSTVVYVR